MHKQPSILHLGIVLSSAAALVSCADGHDQLAQSGSDKAHNDIAIATVKPGADVEFSHEFLQNPIVGGPRLVRLTIDEAYDTGEMEVRVVESDGVNVLTDPIKMINLAAGDRHVWDLQFEAPLDGRHYIGVQATIEQSSGTPVNRAYAIPVYIGDVSNYQPEVEGLDIKQGPSGEPVAAMRARETIRE